MAQASAEKLEHTGPAEKKEWPQCQRERAVGKYARAAIVKRKRNIAVCPEYQVVKWDRVKVGESRTLARKSGSELEHGKERVAFTVKESRFQGRKEGQARRASLGEVEGSMRG